MRKFLQILICFILFVSIPIIGCGGKTVVTQEDPEGMEMKRRMAEQFMGQQQQAQEHVLPDQQQAEQDEF